MSRAGIFETVVGAGVIVVAALFMFYAYSQSGKDIARGAYSLNAVFGRVDGVTVGSEVRIAGIKVGNVAAYALDPRTYEARLRLSLSSEVKVPEDSVAKIVADGLIGGAHVSIEPGASDVMLAAGEQIVMTQGSVDLLGLAMRAFSSNATSKDSPAPVDDPLGDIP